MKGSMKKIMLGACAAAIAVGGMVQSASALEIVFAISAKGIWLKTEHVRHFRK